MKILFLTDSLSLPRADTSEKVSLEETYFHQLKKHFPEHEFVLVAIGGATIFDLYKQLFYYKALEADLVFLQCGIVDCAPRAFTKNETKFLTKTKLSKVVKPLQHFLRKYRGHRYTKPAKFHRYLTSFCNELKSSTIYSIGILPGSTAYDKLVPGISKSIERYNKMLAAQTKFIDNASFPADGIMADHHHLNAKGHTVIFDKIKEIITKLSA